MNDCIVIRWLQGTYNTLHSLVITYILLDYNLAGNISLITGGTERLSCCMEQRSMILEWICGVFNMQFSGHPFEHRSVLWLQGCWLYLW